MCLSLDVDSDPWEPTSGGGSCSSLEHHFETTDADHLPGSLFDAVLDHPLEEEFRRVLRDTAGGSVHSLNLDASDVAPDVEVEEQALFELGEQTVWNSPADISLNGYARGTAS